MFQAQCNCTIVTPSGEYMYGSIQLNVLHLLSFFLKWKLTSDSYTKSEKHLSKSVHKFTKN